jgi:chaperone BCS1
MYIIGVTFLLGKQTKWKGIMDLNQIIVEIRAALDSAVSTEFFKGGFLIAVIGALAVKFQTLPRKIFQIVDRYSSVELVVDDGCDTFSWLSKYCNDLFENSTFGSFYVVDSDDPIVPSGSRWKWLSIFCLSKIMLTKRELESKAGQSRGIAYTISVKVIGFRKRKQLDQLLHAAKLKYGPAEEKIRIKKAVGRFLDDLGPLPERRISTIYSDSLEVISKDLDTFLHSKDAYVAKGIPYRRGYLLKGPPGTGKTTIACQIARQLNRDLLLVNIDRISGMNLGYVLSQDKQLVLFEDIDAYNTSVARDDNGTGNIDDVMSISEMLNAIDGVCTGQDIVYIFTTNCPEKLDPALKRPGRIDMQIELGYVSDTEFDKMCRSFYGEPAPSSRSVKQITHSEVQNEYLKNKGNFDIFIEKTTQPIDFS